MALTVTRITVGTPTLDAITLGAGGSLTVGTTYYYRLICVRSYAGVYALSAASAEQSVTPTAGNQTAQLTWSAVTNANAYIVQRTTTSGSYPLATASCFSLKTQGYSSYIYATTLLYLNDDNGATSNLQWNSLPLDFETEHALVEADGGGTGTTVTLYDIAQSLAGGGFTELQTIGSTMMLANANWQSQGLHQLRGHLYIKNCTFRMLGTLLCYGGDLKIYTDVITQIGDPAARYYPMIRRMSMPLILYTSNNSTYTGYYNCGGTIQGKAGSTNYVNLFVDRPFTRSAVGGYGYGDDPRYTSAGDYGDCTTTYSVIGACAGNMMAFEPTATSGNNVVEGVKLYGTLLNSTVQNGSYLAIYWHNNAVVKGCTTQNLASYDLAMWYSGQLGANIIDHTFKAKGQTDNQPYLWQTMKPNDTAAVIFSVTRNFYITDEAGNPISGVNVSILNSDGISGFWEASGATFTTNLAEASGTTFTVTDGTLFSVGEYIRLECYGEILKVAGIAGNVLTVDRAQLGTSARKTNTSYNVRVLKMVMSKTTDANGEITCAEPILQRELYSVYNATLSQKTAWENDHITSGWMNRKFYGHYTMRISKSGYKSYSNIILDPDVNKFPLGPETVAVALSKVKDLNFSKHCKRISQ